MEKFYELTIIEGKYLDGTTTLSEDEYRVYFKEHTDAFEYLKKKFWEKVNSQSGTLWGGTIMDTGCTLTVQIPNNVVYKLYMKIIERSFY